MSKNLETYRFLLNDNEEIYSSPHILPIIHELANIKDHCHILCENPNPLVIKIIGSDPKLISETLSANPLNNAIDILYTRPKLIDYKYLSSNTNPRIKWLLKENYPKLYIRRLLKNPVIFPLFKFTATNTQRVIDSIEQITRVEIEQLNMRVKLLGEIIGRD